MAGRVHSDGAPLSPQRLTPREIDVLQRTSMGRTNAQIAEEIGTSVHAVKFHLASVFRKLNVNNRTEAAMAYVRFSSEASNAAAEG